MVKVHFGIALNAIKYTWKAVWDHSNIFLVGLLLLKLEELFTEMTQTIINLALPGLLFFFSICCLNAIVMACLLPFNKQNGLRNDIQELLLYDLILHFLVFVVWACMSKQLWPGLALLPPELWVDWHIGTAYMVANATIQYLKFARLMWWRTWPVFGLLGLLTRSPSAGHRRAGVPFLCFAVTIVIVAWLALPVKLAVKTALCYAVLVVLLVRVALDWQRQIAGLLNEIKKLRLAVAEPANERADFGSLQPRDKMIVEAMIYELKQQQLDEEANAKRIKTKPDLHLVPKT